MEDNKEFMKVFHAGDNNNIYILHNGNDAVIIDPCTDSKKFIQYLESINCQTLRILLTHGHEDHISAIPGLMQQYKKSKIMISEPDLQFLTDPDLNGSSDTSKPLNLFRYTRHFQTIMPGEKIQIGQFSLEVFSTPGHTPGSVIFIDDEHKCAFTGDTLFKEAIGVTNLPGGNQIKMRESLLKIVKRIPDDYTLYPGHDESTTMANEKKFNYDLISCMT